MLGATGVYVNARNCGSSDISGGIGSGVATRIIVPGNAAARFEIVRSNPSDESEVSTTSRPAGWLSGRSAISGKEEVVAIDVYVDSISQKYLADV